MRWVIFVVLYVLMTFYSHQAVKVAFKSAWFQYFLIAMSFIVLGNFVYHWVQPSVGKVLSPSKSYALGFLLAFVSAELILVVFMLGEDIIRLFSATYHRFFTPDSSFHLPSRRVFIGKLAIGIAAIPFAGLIYGMFKGKYDFRVLSYTLEFDDLPEAFDGYRITQISDIHSGSFDNHKKIEYAVDLINEQESDTILFTGDLVNNLAAEMDNWSELFSTLKAKDGVYSILGNHDYGDYMTWPSDTEKVNNLNRLKEIQAEMSWKLLLNEHTSITRGEDKINIVGVENWGKGGFVKHGDVDKAAEGLSKEDFKILLSHDPSYWQEKIKSDEKHYQLTLSGHTHGMQFGIEIPGWIKWSPIQYRYENWAGIYKEFGRYMNVNRGFGYLGYPGRVGIWPEITVIKLKRKTA
ncbi:metallophosphoesterase [Mesonia sp.]|uniref:metallophosphoesterase n=1 Tax=Mesonia sp. TaxID=1960830 RepID=UPI003F98E2CA